MGIREMITKSGKRYRAEAMVNGQRYSQTFKRKRDAEVFLETILAMRVKHSGSNQYEEKLLLGKAWTEAINDKIAAELEDCTIRAYVNSSRPFQPLFERDVTKITDDEFITIFKGITNFKTGATLSKSHLKTYRDHLCTVLRKAVDLGYSRPGIDTLFIKMTTIAKKRGAKSLKVPSYTQSEVDILVKTKPKRGLFYAKAILLLLLITGKRIGELLGLTDDKIDFETNEIDISQQISKGLYHPHLKHDAPPEVVDMDENVRNIILDLMAFNEMRGLGNEPWLFPSPSRGCYGYSEMKNKKNRHECPYDGKPLTREIVERKVKEFMEDAGVPVRKLHNVRKTSCTLTYIRFASDNMVGEICRRKMNHKSVQTTFDYYIDVPDEVIKERTGDTGISDILNFKDKTPVSGIPHISSNHNDDLQLLEKKKELLQLEIQIAELKNKKAS